MEPSLIHSIIDNFHAQLNISKQTTNSPHSNSNSTIKNKNGSQIIVNGDVINVSLPDGDLAQTPSGFKKGYHAVFLNSGQVYFGKLEVIHEQRFIKLTDVYYLQQADSNDSSEVSLVKLGEELHAPFDEMNINVNKIIFWERLKDIGPVVSAILKYEDSQDLNND